MSISATSEYETPPKLGDSVIAGTSHLAIGESAAQRGQRALLNILEDFAAEKLSLEHGQRAILNILDDSHVERVRMEGAQRAVLNILDDFTAEKLSLEHGQRAILNILDDSDIEKARLEGAQRAVLNILDDFTAEKLSLEHVQRAILNILDDSDIEKARMEGAQRAVLNILDDFSGEKALLEETHRAALNILDDFEMEKHKVELANQLLEKEVAERKSAEEQVRLLNEGLEQKVKARTVELAASNRELEAFAYSVSHDLRAPLRHIDGFLSLLKKKAYSQLDQGAQHYIDNATEASGRLGRLIDELLQFSRLGRREILKKLVNLNEIVAQVRQELDQEFQDRVVRWRVDDLPTVAADQVMLRQIFENLLVNALKFTRTRAEAEIVVSSHREPDGNVVISVRDNGVGFNMEYYDKLFQVFQRLHLEDEFEGTGIGLANVRRMVERHGGRVWAEGAVDQGATFYFSLPPNRANVGEKNELTEAHSVS